MTLHHRVTTGFPARGRRPTPRPEALLVELAGNHRTNGDVDET